MRPGITPEIISTLEAPKITTAIMARLEFKSGPVFLWTGIHAITPMGTGDALIDGFTFDPVAAGVAVEIGENTFTQSGSNEFTLALNIPSSPDIALAAAQTYPAEFKTRPATIWRALKLEIGNDPLAAPVWAMRRIRSGSMDKLSTQGDGQRHTLTLTIESHQGKITNASNQSYLDQRKYDPNDSSQDHSVAIANGSPTPTKGVSYNPGGSGSNNFVKQQRGYLD